MPTNLVFPLNSEPVPPTIFHICSFVQVMSEIESLLQDEIRSALDPQFNGMLIGAFGCGRFHTSLCVQICKCLQFNQEFIHWSFPRLFVCIKVVFFMPIAFINCIIRQILPQEEKFTVLLSPDYPVDNKCCQLYQWLDSKQKCICFQQQLATPDCDICSDCSTICIYSKHNSAWYFWCHHCKTLYFRLGFWSICPRCGGAVYCGRASLFLVCWSHSCVQWLVSSSHKSQ